MARIIVPILVIVAIFAFDFFIDLPTFLAVPELWDCVTAEEISSGEKDRGFQFCGFNR